MKKEKLNTEETNECWVLLILNFYSKTGATLEEIYKEDKRKINLDYTKILNILDKLEKEKLINKKSQQIQLIYFITSAGREKLKNNINKLNNKDFVDFINLAPPEIILSHRVYNIENSLFFGVLGYMLFQFSIWLIQFQKILSACIILFLSMFSIGCSIGYFSNTITFVIYRLFKPLKEKLEKWKKITSILEFLSKQLNNLYYKIRFLIFIILLIPILIYINWRFYQKFPEEWEIFCYSEIILLVIGLIYKAYKKIKEKSFLIK
ncbi:MAG: hypothetical protein PHF86_11430 [Candidatus Nanoarchaeia archaeon]|nr:hypothetical protein [Candidatus Nanoarchaeia archaeon]